MIFHITYSGGQSIEISDKFFRTEASEHKEANDNYLDVNGESYKEEVSSNVDSPVLSSAANDTFWELFLSETLDSPVASTDPNMDAEGPSETGALLLDGGAVDDGTNVFTDLNAGDHLQAAQDNGTAYSWLGFRTKDIQGCQSSRKQSKILELCPWNYALGNQLRGGG